VTRVVQVGAYGLRMTSSPAHPAPPSTPHARALRARPSAAATPDAAAPRLAVGELRDLLEANLHALRALHDEHQRMLNTSLQSIEAICADLRNELRAIGNARAPWVRAMSETRALVFVALRELVVGAHEAEVQARASDRVGAIDAAIAALDLDTSQLPEPADVLELGDASDPRDFPHRMK
jgi:hypothetical protein